MVMDMISIFNQAALDALAAPTDVSIFARTLSISEQEAVRWLIELENSGHIRRLSQFNPPLFMAYINGPLPDRLKYRSRYGCGTDAMILRYLETHSPSSVTGIVKATGLPRGTVIHALKRLETNGKIMPTPHVKRVRGKTLIWQLSGVRSDGEIYPPRPLWAEPDAVLATAMIDGQRRVVWLSRAEAYRIAEEIKGRDRL